MTIWDYVPPTKSMDKLIPFDSNCNGAFKLMFLVVFFILCYNIFMALYWPHKSRTDVDVFNRKIFDFDYFMGNCCSMWPISHFIFFFILGLLFPDCDIPIITAGVLWEIAEETISIISKNQKNRHIVVDKNSNVQYRDSWWAGSFQDILFNILGFYMGKILIKLSKKKINIKGLTSI